MPSLNETLKPELTKKNLPEAHRGLNNLELLIAGATKIIQPDFSYIVII